MSPMIVAKMVAVLWGAVLVMSLIAWGIVEGICQGVRKFNKMEEQRRHDAEARRQLESWEWSDDG